MKLLVIGASGFLGGTLLRRLRTRGVEVLGTQCSTRHPGLLPFDLARDRIAERLPAAWRATAEPRCAVVCTTARTMDDCATPAASDHVHVERTLQLIRDLTGICFRVLFVSTGYVFDGSVGYYTEDEPPCPLGNYGRQKHEVEKVLRTELPQTLIFRLEKLVSEESNPRNLFTQWLDLIRVTRPIECITGQIFAPTAVADVADAAWLGLERGLMGIYHVCNTEFFLREELAFQFCRVMGVKANIISKPMHEFGFADPRPLKTYLDPSKFRQATGFDFTPMRKVMECFRGRCGASHTISF